MDMKEFLGEVASNMGSHRKTLDLELCFVGCLATENSNLQNLGTSNGMGHGQEDQHTEELSKVGRLTLVEHRLAHSILAS